MGIESRPPSEPNKKRMSEISNGQTGEKKLAGKPELSVTNVTEGRERFDTKSEEYDFTKDASLAENVFIVEPDQEISKIYGPATEGSDREVKEVLNVYDLLDKAAQGDEEAVQKLVTPRGVLQGDTTVEEVLSHRNKERADKTRKGEFLKLLDVETTFDVSMDHPGVKFFVEPADYDTEKAKFVPNWKLRAVEQNGTVVTDPELLGKLKINKKFESIFDLSEPQSDAESNGYRNITIKRAASK